MRSQREEEAALRELARRLEDYNAVFLIQLESWEAAMKSGLMSIAIDKRHQPLEIAALLGSTTGRGDAAGITLNATARACHAAFAAADGSGAAEISMG